MSSTPRDMSSSLGLLLLGLAAGGGMLWLHGMPKLLSFSEKALVFPDPLGVGAKASLGLTIFAEVFCAAAVLLGLFTRAALVPLLVAMGVAFFVIHGADPVDKKELALLYGVSFIVLLLTGPGRFSVDQLKIGKKA